MTPKRAATVTSLTYFVRALLAIPEDKRTEDVGVGAKPWCELLDQVTRTMRPELCQIVRPLLSSVLRKPENLTPAQQGLVGHAARRLLLFGWEQGDPGSVRQGIIGVCKTLAASPEESVRLLDRILAPGRLAYHGFEELPVLTRELEGIMKYDSAFVERVYQAALTYSEESDEATAIGDSALVSLRSNRRQDYELALYSLGELFPKFMKAAPVEATGAVIQAVKSRIASSSRLPVDEIPADSIRVAGETALFASDHSHIWDSGYRHRHDIDLQLLDGFEEGLVTLAGQDDKCDVLARVLGRVGRENKFAAMWRRILSSAAKEPAGLGMRIWTMALSPAVLYSDDTTTLIGRFLPIIFPLLNPAERASIERAILSLKAPDAQLQEYYDQARDRLLGCLQGADLATEEARARLQELAAEGGPPENAPRFQMGEVQQEEFTEAVWLQTEGVDIEAECNRNLRRLYEPAGQFASKFLNDAPTKEDVATISSDIRILHRSLLQRGEADILVIDTGWTHLSAVCAAIARAEWLERDQALLAFIRSVLLEVSVHEQPRPDPVLEEHYEHHGTITRAPRWYAADGLMSLARFQSQTTANVPQAIRSLSEDPVTQVRSAIAMKLGSLYRTDRDLFWNLLKRIESTEPSRRVIYYALVTTRHLAGIHRSEMIGTAQRIFRRFQGDPEASDIRCECLRIVLTGHVVEQFPYGDELVGIVVRDMTAFAAEAVYLVQCAADSLMVRDIDPADTRADHYRRESFTFLLGIAKAVQEWVQKLTPSLQGKSRQDLAPDLIRQIDAARRVGHELGIRLYFASGAFDEKMGRSTSRRATLTHAMKTLFLHEAAPLLTLLTDLGFADAVHNALETLVAYVSIDPRTVFLAAAQAVRNGQKAGYHFEDLAVSLVVGLVRRYIADYPSLFREHVDCRNALMDILNIFVRAGWPEAIELTGRLDQVFR